MSDEADRERIAEELRRIRDTVRDRALHEPPRAVLGPPAAVREPQPMPRDPEPAPVAAVLRPDNGPLNALMSTAGDDMPGGRLARAVRRLLQPILERQQVLNSRQVQFDNELLGYIDARLDQTHRHYDDVLGIHGRHMGEIDERHMILQEELVAHVHDLVRRIDLVLADSERGRVGLESALRDVRERLTRLERSLEARGKP